MQSYFIRKEMVGVVVLGFASFRKDGGVYMHMLQRSGH